LLNFTLNLYALYPLHVYVLRFTLYAFLPNAVISAVFRQTAHYRSYRWLNNLQSLKLNDHHAFLTNLIQTPFWWKYRNMSIKSGTISSSHFNLTFHNNHTQYEKRW